PLSKSVRSPRCKQWMCRTIITPEPRLKRISQGTRGDTMTERTSGQKTDPRTKIISRLSEKGSEYG
ncbi:hypothetical protein LTS12_028160, partial [Elasticomyces elasticus]